MMLKDILYIWILLDYSNAGQLIVPRAGNCNDKTTLTCMVNNAYGHRLWSKFDGNRYMPFIYDGQVYDPLPADKYSEIINPQNFSLLISNTVPNDVGQYQCENGFSPIGNGSLEFECKAKTVKVTVQSDWTLVVTAGGIYPRQQTFNVSTTLNNVRTAHEGTATYVQSTTDATLYIATWISTSHLSSEGDYQYDITVTAVTQAGPFMGTFRIVSPSKPVIQNTESLTDKTTVIRGIQDQQLSLQCQSGGGYPLTNMVWLRGSSGVRLGNTQFTEEKDNTYTVNLTYPFTPKRTDDLVNFICQSSYPVSGDDPLSSDAKLYLKLKPTAPSVSQTGTVTAGHLAHINCETAQARPAANISWLYKSTWSSPSFTSKEDETTETFVTNSTFIRRVQREDNGQTLTCLVSHEIMSASLSATATVSVQFPPTTLSLDGNQPIIADGQNALNFSCTTDTANPVATVAWQRETTTITVGASQTNTSGGYGGRLTTGHLHLIPTRDMDGDAIWCLASNSVNQEDPVKKTTFLNLQYSPVVVTSEPSPRTVNETDLNVILHCSVNSKPKSTFSWYHNGSQLPNNGISQKGNRSNYTLSTVHRTDFGSYRCVASNTIPPAGEKSVSLHIQFRPLAVRVTGNRNIEAKNNNKLYLVCETETANPIATITWRNGSTEIPNTSQVTNKAGLYGGTISKQTLTLVPTRYMDGDIIFCEGSNSLSGNSLATTSTMLNVNYYPISTAVEGPVKTVTEGQPNVSLTCLADSKPAATFKWYKDASTNPVKSGLGTSTNNQLIYTIDVVNRGYAGDYRCMAQNGIGSPDNSNGLVKLVVQYPPDITLTTSNTTVNASNAEINCSPAGVPASYTFTPWNHSWAGTNIVIRAQLPSVSSVSSHEKVLRLDSLSYQDTGIYTCGASNGVALWGTANREMVNSVYLVVKTYPIIIFPEDRGEGPFKITPRLKEQFSVNVSFYSNADELEAKLYRERNATLDGNSTLDLVANASLNISKSEVDLGVYDTSVRTAGYLLTLSHTLVQSFEFGAYVLKITNEIGGAEFSFQTTPEGPPCSPKSPAIDDFLETAITVSWIRCYHGGYPQTFVIQYREEGNLWTNGSSKEGGLSTSEERIDSTVEGLNPGTIYYIHLFAYNKEGRSDFTETMNITTIPKPDVTETASNVGLIVGAAVGGVVLAAIFILALLLIRRSKYFSKSPSKVLLKDNDRPIGTQTNDEPPEINLNPMYESAGPLPSTSNNIDVYSQVDKTKKQTKAVGDIYSQVNNIKKKPKAGGSHDKNDVYAQVQKTSKKENAKGKVKQKKQKADKKTKQEKNTEGMIYDNVDTTNSAATEADNVYENPSCSTEDEKPKQIRNQDGLIYVELDLPKLTVGTDKKAIIHGLDNSTDYADIKFGEVGQQAPESDEEDNKKEG